MTAYARRQIRPPEVTKLLDDASKQWPVETVFVLVKEMRAVARYIEDIEFDLETYQREKMRSIMSPSRSGDDQKERP
jgi:hypothetical protein